MYVLASICTVCYLSFIVPIYVEFFVRTSMRALLKYGVLLVIG